MRRQRTGHALRLLLMIGLLSVAALTMASGAPSAAAQLSCSDQPASYMVAAAPDLNAAIACHNASPDASTTITLTADIESTSIAGGAVFTEIEGGTLRIEGNGYTLRRGPLAGADEVPVLAFSSGPISAFGSGTGLWLTGMQIEVGPHDTVGVKHDGDLPMAVTRTRIVGVGASPQSIGLLADGDDNLVTTVNRSSISGVGIGLQIDRSLILLEKSTVASTQTDLRVATGIWHTVSKSTLAGPVGIELTDGTVRVENSTILGDGAAVTEQASPNAAITFQSSIANTCSGDELALDSTSGPGWVDLGFNAGACFDAAAPVALTLANNGCEPVNLVLCAETAAIAVDSPARRAGLCSPGMVGDNRLDQRGALRTPAGFGCDAGSFEYGCDIQDQFEPVEIAVSTTDQFNEAIRCFNLGAANVEITLLNDIAAAGLEPASVFAPIRGFGDLLIAGNGHSLRRDALAGVEALPLLTLDNPAGFRRVTLTEIDLELGPADTAAIANTSSAEFSVTGSAIRATTPGSTAVGITSTNEVFTAFIIDTSIEGVATGLRFGPSRFFLTSSTIVSTDVDIDVIDEIHQVFNSTLGGPTGIEITNGAVQLINSTVLGEATSFSPNAQDGTVSFYSSIANTCSAPERIEGQEQSINSWVQAYSAGACFNSAEPVPLVLADNGCAQPRLLPCPKTAAISTDSPARGVGRCSPDSAENIFATDIDQRGEPRTPAGHGCDAGAYEAPDTPPPGDVTDNGVVDNADAQALLDWLAGGPEPADLERGDLVQDGLVKLDDVLRLAQRITYPD